MNKKEDDTKKKTESTSNIGNNEKKIKKKNISTGCTPCQQRKRERLRLARIKARGKCKNCPP